jgi:peptidoglycan-N-acetylglucosamine deacetylase
LPKQVRHVHAVEPVIEAERRSDVRRFLASLALAGLVVASIAGVVFVSGFVRPAKAAGLHAVAAFAGERSIITTEAFAVAETPGADVDTVPEPAGSAETARLLRLKALHQAPPPYILAQSIMRVPRPGRRVVITFDDGPSKNTGRILDVLRRYGARATFFYVGGRCVGHADVLQATLAEGSEIANHTADHVSLLGHSLDWDKGEIQRAEDEYFADAGVRPVWVRPQSGWADRVGIEAMKALGKRYVFWDDFGSDTVAGYTVHDISARVLRLAQPGSIILLHETNPRTVLALPSILEGLQARGLEAVTLTQAMGRPASGQNAEQRDRRRLRYRP